MHLQRPHWVLSVVIWLVIEAEVAEETFQSVGLGIYLRATNKGSCVTPDQCSTYITSQIWAWLSTPYKWNILGICNCKALVYSASLQQKWIWVSRENWYISNIPFMGFILYTFLLSDLVLLQSNYCGISTFVYSYLCQKGRKQCRHSGNSFNRREDCDAILDCRGITYDAYTREQPLCIPWWGHNQRWTANRWEHLPWELLLRDPTTSPWGIPHSWPQGTAIQ